MQKTPWNRYIENIGFKLEISYRFPKTNIAQHYLFVFIPTMLCSADRINKETSSSHYKEPANFALLEVVYKFCSVKYGLLAIYSTME